jgi:hypothetical protein
MRNRNNMAKCLLQPGVMILWIGLLGMLSTSAPRDVCAEPNIIVFMADDLDWDDLPFFNPPVQWDDPDNPVPLSTTTTSLPPAMPREEAELRAPDMNRISARMFATPTNSDGVAALGNADVGSSSYPVVPVDIDFNVLVEGENVPGNNDSASTFRYYEGGAPTNTDADPCTATNADVWKDYCRPASDILHNYGGLARMARDGVVFPRFYAAAARCSPSRAAFITGQYERRAGVVDVNDTSLPTNQVTLAQFLKQGCDDDSERLCLNPEWVKGDDPTTALNACDCYVGTSTCTNADAAACYTTGLIGK